MSAAPAALLLNPLAGSIKPNTMNPLIAAVVLRTSHHAYWLAPPTFRSRRLRVGRVRLGVRPVETGVMAAAAGCLCRWLWCPKFANVNFCSY